MFVPGLAECEWQTGEADSGLVVKRCQRGDLYEYRERSHVSRVWFTSTEEAEFLDLVRGHSGTTAGRWIVTRYKRLAFLVVRQLDLVRWHDHAFLEGIEPESLVSIQHSLDGGMKPGARARAEEPFKLVNRHPRLGTRVDEFVVRVQSHLRI